jgi:hypothetical protein
LFLLSFQRLRSHNFQYFVQNFEIFRKKFCLALQVQSDADPTRFGSITLDNQSKLYVTSTESWLFDHMTSARITKDTD